MDKKTEEELIRRVNRAKPKKRKRNTPRTGTYVVINTAKYMGKVAPVYRSSWERKVCKYLDSNPKILKWQSEGLPIAYYNTVKKRPARYFPDFIVQLKGVDGKMRTIIIEVKPYKETQKPIARQGKKKSSLLYEQATYKINTAKWDAARIYCAKRGWEFSIMTERSIYNKKK